MNKNKWFLNGGRGSGRAIRLLCETYENRIADLEEENAELKERADKADLDSVLFFNQLCKAKKIIKEFVHHYKAKTIYIEDMKYLLEQAEQFLSEVEK